MNLNPWTGSWLLATFAWSATAYGQQTDRTLSGGLEFRGDRWPVELAIERETDSEATPKATLSLPDLVYADEPADLRRDPAGVLTLKMPFGLGDYPLEALPDGGYFATAQLGGDTASLNLRLNSASLTRRQVEFPGDGVRLKGTLYLPRSPGPHPGVVVLHGSGPMDRSRWIYRSWGDAFARLGVAALVYDKRGTGKSTGDFLQDSAFQALTADALAAAAFLRQQAVIDPDRVGLAGWSQGGWSALQAAARDTSVAFLVLMSPPAFTPAEQEMQAIALRLRQNGFTEIDIGEAIAYTRLYFAVAATGRGWEWLQAETRRLPEAPWSDFVQWPEHPDDLAWWRRHMGFEPASIIADVRAPTIAFFGREDPIVPAPANAGRLRELYRGAAPLEIVTAPGADHRLEVPAGTDALGRWTFPRISPPVMRALEAFLLEVATMKQ